MTTRQRATSRLLLIVGLGFAALAAAVLPATGPAEDPVPATRVEAGPLVFTERQVGGGYTYAYGVMAADLDGDGNLDLTSSDAEDNSNLYWYQNDGKGNFTRRFIQKYAGKRE